MRKNTFDLVAQLTTDMSNLMGRGIDFEMFYAPAKEDYELALDLNAGKRITNGRTRGAKMLKKLKDKAREEWCAPKK